MSDWKTLYQQHFATLVARHTEATERGAVSGLFIDAGAPRYHFRDDQEVSFRPTAWFRQWLPLPDAAHCGLYFRPGVRPVLFYYQPRDYWHATPADPAGFWVDAFDIHVVNDAEELARAVAATVPANTAYLGADPDRFPQLPLAAINPDPVCDYLDFYRASKTAFEQASMAAATAQSVRGHVAAARAYAGGGSEFDVLFAYLQGSAQTEQETPYGSIVAENEHAAVLHYQHRDRGPAKRRHGLLIDAGAQHHGYAADITRTYAAAPGEFADLVAAMDAAQQQMIASIRPGMDFVDLHAAAHRAVGNILTTAGLVTTSVDAAIESGITRTFLPHGLGHLLGLHTHDAGGHLANDRGGRRPPPARDPALRNTRTVEVDQAFTIEPGIYFIPMLLNQLRSEPAGKYVRFDRVEALLPCGGIRIEDNVIVTGTGVRNLTREAFAAQT